MTTAVKTTEKKRGVGIDKNLRYSVATQFENRAPNYQITNIKQYHLFGYERVCKVADTSFYVQRDDMYMYLASNDFQHISPWLE